jgi:hypothetical protein
MRMRTGASFTGTAAVLLAVAQLAGCATATNVTPIAPKLAPRAGNCEVTVIGRGGTVPSEHTPIATIESHIQRNLFFGGRVTLLEDSYKEPTNSAATRSASTTSWRAARPR